jgi:hypothetical protein
VVFVHGFPDHSDRPEFKSFTEKVARSVGCRDWSVVDVPPFDVPLPDAPNSTWDSVFGRFDIEINDAVGGSGSILVITHDFGSLISRRWIHENRDRVVGVLSLDVIDIDQMAQWNTERSWWSNFDVSDPYWYTTFFRRLWYAPTSLANTVLSLIPLSIFADARQTDCSIYALLLEETAALQQVLSDNPIHPNAAHMYSRFGARYTSQASLDMCVRHQRLDSDDHYFFLDQSHWSRVIAHVKTLLPAGYSVDLAK